MKPGNAQYRRILRRNPETGNHEYVYVDRAGTSPDVASMTAAAVQYTVPAALKRKRAPRRGCCT